MAMRLVLFVPALAQFGVLIVWGMGWSPHSRVGVYTQLAALFISLVIGGGFVIQRCRLVRRTYQDIKRRRVDQAHAFQNFVDAHLPRH